VGGAATGSADAAAAAVQRRGAKQLSLGLSTPARLRALLLASIAVSLLWGVVATWTAVQRVSAANSVVSSSGPLNADARQIYQSLSEADATEANAYLSLIEPSEAITGIHGDTSRAEADVMAIRAGDSDPAIQADLTTLATGIPDYMKFVGEADAYNRSGINGAGIGAAYLRDASALDRGSLLKAARDLYTKEHARLNNAYAQATGFPFLAAGVAFLIAIAAFWAQRWLARRTRRLINPGLAMASLIGLLSLVWVLASFYSARSDLLAGRDGGSTPAYALAQAEITALQMHSDESLTLINRDGAYDTTEGRLQTQLWPALRGELIAAQSVGAGSPGETDATAAARGAQAWWGRHMDVFNADNSGNYIGVNDPTSAVALATGPSTIAFGEVDHDLTTAIDADQAASARYASSGDDALGGLVVGMVIAALLMAAACTWGVGKRLAEYR
jgi:hypothetical protein